VVKIPIFIINLEKDYIKKDAIKIRCEKQKLQPLFMNAIDGFKEVEKNNKIQYRNLTPGEIGCALSHKMIYKTIVKKGIAWSVVLEDDIRFDENFSEIIKRFEIFPKNCEILLLGHHSCNARWLPTARSFRRVHPLYPGYLLARPVENSCGTYGYMISFAGAKRLLKEMEQIDKPIDHYTGDCSNNGLWIVHPPVVLIDEELDQYSAIEKDRCDKNLAKYGWKERLLQSRIVRNLYRGRHLLLSLIKGWMVGCQDKKGSL